MAERERERERERELESYFNPTDDLREKLIELAKENAHLRSQLSKQRYGLVWLDVPEEFEKESEDRIPILEEVPEKEIRTDDGKPCHILIEGENYHALTCLNYTHRGKVDVIYIDPPYNTGSDGFRYRDKRFSTEFPNGVPVPKDSPFRHSYWLSFMAKRLELAKNLLSDHGVIFISIDDNEQANLKLLCDQVFGEDNSVASVIWQGKYTTSNDSKDISRQHEYLLTYCQNRTFMNFGLLSRTDEMNAAYRNPDNDPKGPWKATPLHAKSGTEAGLYTITFPNGYIWSAPKGRYPRYSQDRLLEIYSNGGLYFNKKGGVDRKTYLSEVKQGKTPGSLWKFDEVGSTHQANEQLAEVLGKGVFDNPKPLGLIQRCTGLGTLNPNATILDFFAGSGTTLHAVMKLNEEDGGNRQCILVQLDENGICENVTYERNRRVMQGYENPKGEQVPGLGNSLKYYRTAFVGKNPPARALDADRIELACKAGYLLAMGENTLFEQTRTETFQIFADSAKKKRVTAIYFEMDIEGLDEFERQVKEYARTAEKVSAYLFSWSNGEEFESMFEEMPNIEVKSIPQPILEIYRTIQK